MIDNPSDKPNSPEFTRPVAVEGIKIGTSDLKLKASRQECTDLAKRFGLIALNHLSAHLKFKRKGQGDSTRITVSGHLSAKLSQTCIITLEPIESEIDADFTTIFDILAESLPDDSDIDSETDELVEPIIGGVVDFGELIAQNLAVEIDPFPRAEGVDSSSLSLKPAESRENPFAVLEKLKNRQN